MGEGTLKLPKDSGRQEVRSVSSSPEQRPALRLDPNILAAIENENEGNAFYYDKTKQPEDMTYEFKRLTYGGIEDKQYQAELKRKGWVPVAAVRHTECGTEDPSGANIVIGGQILMERHVEYTRRAREIAQRKNNQQVTGQFERLQLSDNPHMPRKVTNLKQTYEAGQEIPA